ncbi:hypothetical protein FQN54_002386 [Arachnomyces sp. PD_36]|nr:hypothetical protein FQN54_002386 [Arachnomyces sp. PD_36]
MHRYYPPGHPNLLGKPEASLKGEEFMKGELEREREDAETKSDNTVMSVEPTTRSSMRLLARTLNSPSKSPNENGKESGYSLRKRTVPDYNQDRMYSELLKKRKSDDKEEKTSPAKPKTPKSTKSVGTPEAPRTPRTPGSAGGPKTPTPSFPGGVRLVVKPNKEAVIERIPPKTPTTFPKFVKFSIGRDGEIFVIPYRYLRLESGFFRNQSGTSADQEKTLDFAEFEAKTFGVFTTWVYYNTFEEGKKQEECALDFMELIQLYQVAETFHVIVLKNVIVDRIIALFNRHNGWVQYTLANEIYRRTVRNSPLRRLWVEFRIRGEGVEQGTPDVNSTFLNDVVERQKELIQDASRGIGISPLVASDFYDVEAVTGRTKERISFF